jgi:flagella basal body P-ring formation protein FlgA
VICSLLAQSAVARQWQSQKSIVDHVRSFVHSQTDINKTDIEIKIGRLDSRLHLTECATGLTAFFPNQITFVGNGSVGIRCESATPWTIFIPVQINIFKTVLTASHPLTRGHALDASDIQPLRMKLTSTNNNYFADPKNIMGLILKRPLAVGKPFEAQLLTSPKLVKRGQEVILLATTASIKVRMSGKALADGAKGDLIQVRNTKTHIVVEGVVTKAGHVQVNM